MGHNGVKGGGWDCGIGWGTVGWIWYFGILSVGFGIWTLREYYLLV